MKTSLLLTAFFLFGILSSFAAPPLEEGRVIFTSRCAGCHNVNKMVTGPALAGVHERRSMEIPMPDHADLSPEKIKSIVDFIKAESKPVETSEAPFAKPYKLRPAFTPLSIQKDYGVFISFFAGIALLIAALLFAVSTTRYAKEL
jgi:hypothetical protein